MATHSRKTHITDSSLAHPPETVFPYSGGRKLGVIQVIFLSRTSYGHLATNPSYHPHIPKTRPSSLIFTATEYCCSKFLTGLLLSRRTSMNLPLFKDLFKKYLLVPSISTNKQTKTYLILLLILKPISGSLLSRVYSPNF